MFLHSELFSPCLMYPNSTGFSPKSLVKVEVVQVSDLTADGRAQQLACSVSLTGGCQRPQKRCKEQVQRLVAFLSKGASVRLQTTKE